MATENLQSSEVVLTGQRARRNLGISASMVLKVKVKNTFYFARYKVQIHFFVKIFAERNSSCDFEKKSQK